MTLFVTLTETVLGAISTQTSGAVQMLLTIFVITFPLLIAAAFFAILWNRPHHLYHPSEYGAGTTAEVFERATRPRPSDLYAVRALLTNMVDVLDGDRVKALVGSIERVEREYQEVRRRENIDLSEGDRARILSLAKDLPAVWRATTTTNAERKNLLRLVVREVTVSPIDVPERMTRVQVLWPTGAVSDVTVPRKDKYTAQATSEPALSLIRDLYLEQNKNDREIAAELNRRGLCTGQDHSWDLGAVRRVRCGEGIFRSSPKARRPPDQRSDGLYSVHALAARAGVKPSAIRYWARTGALKPEVAHGGPGPGRPHWFKLDAETIDRLRNLAEQYAQRRLPGSPQHRPPGRRRSADAIERGVKDEPSRRKNPASPRPPR